MQARAAAIVLFCVLLWPLADVVAAAIETGLIALDVVPPLAGRIALGVVVNAVRLAMMIGAIRVGEAWSPPRGTLWALFAACAVFGFTASLASTGLYQLHTVLFARAHTTAEFGEYVKDGSILGVVNFAVHSVVVIAAAAYAVSRSGASVAELDEA